MFLKLKYRRFKCQTHTWNHRDEVNQKVKKLTSCSDIMLTYPHVHRAWRNDTMCVESLVFRGEVLHKIEVQQPIIDKDFSL